MDMDHDACYPAIEHETAVSMGGCSSLSRQPESTAGHFARPRHVGKVVIAGD
jgi:hypothetical protein